MAEEPTQGETKPQPPALTGDDVLDAHEILRTYTGAAEGLFQRLPT